MHRSGVVINAPALGGSGAAAGGAHKVVDKPAAGDVDRTTICVLNTATGAGFLPNNRSQSKTRDVHGPARGDVQDRKLLSQ